MNNNYYCLQYLQYVFFTGKGGRENILGVLTKLNEGKELDSS